jgi:hypothetical protein
MSNASLTLTDSPANCGGTDAHTARQTNTKENLQ